MSDGEYAALADLEKLVRAFLSSNGSFGLDPLGQRLAEFSRKAQGHLTTLDKERSA